MGTVAFVCEHCGQAVKRFRRPGQRRLCRYCGELALATFNSGLQRDRLARKAVERRLRVQARLAAPLPPPRPRRKRQAAPRSAPAPQGRGATLAEALANAVESG